MTRIGDKLHKLASRLRTVHGMDDLYRSLVSEWHDPAALVLAEGGTPLHEPQSLLDDALPATGMGQQPLPMMYRDSMTYLPRRHIVQGRPCCHGHQPGNTGSFPWTTV